jgi:mitochondrial splicing suppressor protein 51
MILALNPRLRVVHRISRSCQFIPSLRTRSLFSLFKKAPSKPESQPTLFQDNLFHPFSRSPFPAIVARGEAVRSLSPCPICASRNGKDHEHMKTQPRQVAFECPDCGWPTHCSEEHWRADRDHAKYCSRLREVNEDEHDLRSGRRLREFELPGALSFHLRAQSHNLPSASVGPQDTEAAISFSNWDVFWYTRNFPSMDMERSRRHASKLLTYPITIGSVLHQYSALTLSNQRLTPEGSRSLAGAFSGHTTVSHS